jgi:hypothetical protein
MYTVSTPIPIQDLFHIFCHKQSGGTSKIAESAVIFSLNAVDHHRIVESYSSLSPCGAGDQRSTYIEARQRDKGLDHITSCRDYLWRDLRGFSDSGSSFNLTIENFRWLSSLLIFRRALVFRRIP